MIYGEEFASFKADCWTKRVHTGELAESTFASLKSELDDFDVHAIARAHNGPIAVWFGQGQHKSVEMSSEDALRFYDAGYQIYITNVTRTVLVEWCRHLSESLDVPNHFSCALLATKAPRLTSTHFEALESFTVQLLGTKVWSVADNTAVRLPTVHYNGNAARHHEELGLFVKEFPISPAPVTQSYRLTPGRVIYVPRGFWHGVSGTVDQPTVSMLICNLPVTWADLIAPAFRTLLLRTERWRESAKLPAFDASVEERTQFRSTLAQAARELSSLQMSFLLPWKRLAPALPPVLVRNPLATLAYEESSERTRIRAISTVHLGPYTRVQQEDIDLDLKPLLDFVYAHNESSLADLEELAAATMPIRDALNILRALDLIRPKALHG